MDSFIKSISQPPADVKPLAIPAKGDKASFIFVDRSGKIHL